MKKYISVFVAAATVFVALLCVCGLLKGIAPKDANDATADKSSDLCTGEMLTSENENIFNSVEAYVEYLSSGGALSDTGSTGSQTIEYSLPTNIADGATLISIELTDEGTVFTYSLQRNPQILVGPEDVILYEMLTTYRMKSYTTAAGYDFITDHTVYAAELAAAVGAIATSVNQYSGNVTVRMEAEDGTFSYVTIGTHMVWIEDGVTRYAYYPTTLSEEEILQLSSFTTYTVDVDAGD